MIKTSVIILNWNGQKLLEQFLPDVLKYSLSENCEVVVADNGSNDDSISFLKNQYPHVPLILFDKNYGFAEGYNKAIKQTKSEYVVLLNSDIQVTKDWLTTLTDYMDAHPKTVAVQPKIRSFKEKEKFEYAGACGGYIDKYGYPFCRGRILDNVEQDNNQYDSVCPVFWATGACLCIRREDYIEVGGLDADFFAHMEEIDLCWRLNARGKKIECVPTSVVYHVGGASLNKKNPQKTYLNFRNNLLMLYKNANQKQLRRILTARLILDFIAFTHLILRGNIGGSKAVLRAYRDFYQLKKTYKHRRQENMQKTIVHNLTGQFSGSILWNYYFKGKKTYKDLISDR